MPAGGAPVDCEMLTPNPGIPPNVPDIRLAKGFAGMGPDWEEVVRVVAPGAGPLGGALVPAVGVDVVDGVAVVLASVPTLCKIIYSFNSGILILIAMKHSDKSIYLITSHFLVS